jgi:aspartyl-tRNA synthetase
MSEHPPLGTSYRTHTCGHLRPGHAGETVSIAGWVTGQRDHGGILFIDLRDRWGITQVVVDPTDKPEGLEAARAARLEDVLHVTGVVRRRPEDQVNRDRPTGACEVVADQVAVLAKTRTPPFVIEEEPTALEDLSLKYRYLDLRRPPLQRNIELRHRTALATRSFFDSEGFLEIETPFLVRSTPEGARDYLVPSRLHHGRFYALPQSPQTYKQLLMMAGFDRYVQIVRCFRDEDLRADRQPEFTQVDVEMAFVQEEDVLRIAEAYLIALSKDVLGVDVEQPFPRLTHTEAMERYGSDKPDLRYGMELRDVSDLVAECEFRIFQSVLESGGTVRGLCAAGAGGPSRKEVDQLTEVATLAGAKGVVPLTVTGDGLAGPVAKFLSPAEQTGLVKRFEAAEGDLLLLVADSRSTALESLGSLRVEMARRLQLTAGDALKFVWVREFPLTEWDGESGRMTAVHHPFTSAADREAFLALVEELPEGTDPSAASESWRARALDLKAAAYDAVLNGHEIGGGSIRINRSEDQAAMFRLLGLSPEEADEKFGFLIEALMYGAPPHGGIAFGFDRIVMLLAGEETIREVIAFPKTTSALSLMDGSPGGVSEDQLRELGLQLRSGSAGGGPAGDPSELES